MEESHTFWCDSSIRHKRGIKSNGASNANWYPFGAKRLLRLPAPSPVRTKVSWVTQPFGLRRHDFCEIPKTKKEPPVRTEILTGGVERYASFMPLSIRRKHRRNYKIKKIVANLIKRVYYKFIADERIVFYVDINIYGSKL